jgi:hypothetical protein
VNGGWAADGLRLAAAPTFAVMALITWGAGPGAMLCSATPGSPLSAFHLAPWLTLISGRRRETGQA